MTKEVMQQAFDLIERLNMRGFILADFETEVYAVITALKTALEQPPLPVQEPVAWQFMNGSNFRKRRPYGFADLDSDGLPYWKPLYTTPPADQLKERNT